MGEDISVPLADGPHTFEYGEHGATVTFIRLVEPLTYEDMYKALDSRSIGRVRLYPIKDPENSYTGEVYFPGSRQEVMSMYMRIASEGKLADERPLVVRKPSSDPCKKHIGLKRAL